MIIKCKKSCKIIYDNCNYYVSTKDYFFKFNNKEDAEFFYNNALKISIDFIRQFDWEGKVYLEFYPDDLEIILKSLEQFKFFCDKSLYFGNRAELKNKSQDCYYLYEYILGMLRNYCKINKKDLTIK